MPCLRSLFLLALTAAPAIADEPAGQLFRREVLPVLVGRCLDCHGAEKKGGLDLRSRATALEGGDSGAVIVPGKPAESLLLEYVQSGEMPPKKPPLAKEQVAAIERWIADGAWLPEAPIDPLATTTDRRAGEDWWSLRPIVKPAPPVVEHPERALTPIDRFVLARLQSAGLGFSPPADRRTYIRRVTLDLTGLVPSYDEVEQFVADTKPDAFERLVDRLLASPHYGERWGRHWLDVVRFAESNGFERDRIRENFWPYRDYVIGAYNSDKPFDRFVLEQLAGDALGSDDPQLQIATGYLVAGAKNDVGTVSELEQKITRQDELDDFVATTGTTFLGLSVGCARCHDHKFDPIRTKDYYSLTAVFSGLDRADRPVPAPADRAHYEALVDAAKQGLQATEASIETALAPTIARLAAEHKKAAPNVPALPAATFDRNEDPADGVRARFVRFVVLSTTGNTEPCLDELEVYSADRTRNLALATAGAKASASSLLPGYPLLHRVEHLNDGQYGNGRSWIGNEAGAGWVQVELAEPAEIVSVVWSRDRQGGFRDRLPLGYQIDVSLDGQTWIKVSDNTRRAAAGVDDKSAERLRGEAIVALNESDRAVYNRLLEEKKQWEESIKSAGAMPVSYSAVDNGPRPSFVLERGNVRMPGEAVKPAALIAIRTLAADLQPAEDSGPARRRRLAEWIIDPQNPLTSRVLVNRVWHYHFGQGIVNTPNDFGFNGDRPSHPELLDWLAADFQEHDWTLKRLQRLIVLSAAYRQSAEFAAAGGAKDGANRLLWRMSPRRLAAEELRDAVLETSGKLNLRLGGPSFRTFEYRDGNVPDYVLLDRPGPETFRRAVYMFNIRTFQTPLMSAFDCPDVSVQNPKRGQSTSALQALSLLNNRFMLDQAEFFAERVASLVTVDKAAGEPADETLAQVTAAYRLALLREPTAEQQQLAVAFVREQGLAALCRVLLNTNEFLYVY